MAAPALRDTTTGRLRAREFLFLTEELALQAVPAALRPRERTVMWTMLQLHFGDPRVHFELQPQPARSIVEVGLHFEADSERNEALARTVAGAPWIQATLGSGWELEEWTASWRRLHRTFPALTLTRPLAEEAARAFALLITTTGDLVREHSRPA